VLVLRRYRRIPWCEKANWAFCVWCGKMNDEYESIYAKMNPNSMTEDDVPWKGGIGTFCLGSTQNMYFKLSVAIIYSH